jgi:hypothetical protein
MQGAANIAQNALQGSKVRLPWVMHVETKLLNCIGEIRSSKGEIL